jgi:signal transduction histidine kinase
MVAAGLPDVSAARMRLRPLSLLVLLVVTAMAVASFVFTRHVVSDQEHKLLKQRTDEAGLYLSSLLGSVRSEFSSLAGTSAATNADPNAFRRSTKLLTAVPGGFATLALVRTSGTPAVVAQSGQPIPTALDGARATAVASAVAHTGLTGGLVSTPLFGGTPADRKLGFAYSSPSLPGYAIYAESDVHPEVSSPTTSGQPFSELIAAVYAGPRVDPNQLIAVTGGFKGPLRGDTSATKAAVGEGEPWLLVAKARRPLVGSAATATPWILLGAVLLVGMLAVVVVETLGRRREYALAVADERTEELKDSMRELGEAQEQLVRSERLAAIGELASTIGHELRNPLGVISNAVYLLRGDLGPTPTDAASRHLATAEREVSAATVIVSDLLEFARQRDPVTTDVDAVGLMEEALSVLPPPTGITAVRNLPEPPVLLSADRDMLRQVLLNLIGNAYQAMMDGGTVTVGLTTDGPRLHLSVTDTGVGMEPDVSRRVFEPFYTTKARGVGLGLAVSRRIVEAHGGEISVVSAPGHGTTFTVTLPRVPVPRQAGDREAGAEVTA